MLTTNNYSLTSHTSLVALLCNKMFTCHCRDEVAERRWLGDSYKHMVAHGTTQTQDAALIVSLQVADQPSPCQHK